MLRALVVLVLVAVSPAAAAVTAARPTAPPPKVVGVGAPPPPAWIAGTRSPSRWLAYGSFCWKTACVDFLPPQMRPDLPRLRARVGDSITFHLGFRPSMLRVQLGEGRLRLLPPARVSTWRVTGLGTLAISAKGPGGSVSYVVRLG